MFFAFAVILFARVLQSSQADEAKGGLFVNLTTDDTWAATKAIMFAHQKVLKRGHKPVAIWLNVRGIYLGDKKRASHVHGLMKDEGQSIQDMLTAFIKDGGTVIACSACSKAAGLAHEDFIDGITWEIRILSLRFSLIQTSKPFPGNIPI